MMIMRIILRLLFPVILNRFQNIKLKNQENFLKKMYLRPKKLKKVQNLIVFVIQIWLLELILEMIMRGSPKVWLIILGRIQQRASILW
jgi:hypothetical protein